MFETSDCTGTNLGRQHEGLHELPHGLHVVGQLAHHLHHHALVQGGVGVHVPDLGVTVPEAQSHHSLVDLLQREDLRLHVIGSCCRLSCTHHVALSSSKVQPSPRHVVKL